MKCALPGMYGKKIAIQSDAIGGGFKEKMLKYSLPDTGASFEKVAKTFNKIRDDFQKQIETDTRLNGKKETEAVNKFEELKRKLLKKDSEAHSQK